MGNGTYVSRILVVRMLVGLAGPTIVLPANAAPLFAYRLDLSASAGAEVCLASQDFARAVEERLRGRAFDREATGVVSVHLDRTPSGYRASVSIVASDHAPARTALEAESCEAAMRAAAVTLALALDEDSQEQRHERVEPPIRSVVLDSEDDTDSSARAYETPPASDRAREEDRPSSGNVPVPFESLKKNWFALEIAQDFAVLDNTTAACSPATQGRENISCFYDNGSAYEGTPDPEFAGTIGGGVGVATTRLLLNYERLLFRRFGVLFRGGVALSGGPTPPGGAAFMPLHAELDARYYVKGKDGSVLEAFVFFGGGIAQVDSDVRVEVVDCSPAGCSSSPDSGERQKLRAYSTDGLTFATAGIGATWMLGDSVGMFGRLGGMAMFPAIGFVVEPSIGLSAGI